MAFELELTTLAGESRGECQPRGLELSRRLNGWMTLSCTIDNHEPVATEALIGSRALRLWEEGSCASTASCANRCAQPGRVTLSSTSPFALLDRRQLQTFRLHPDRPGDDRARPAARPERPRHDASADGDLPASKLRDRTYEMGKSVRELIEQLAAVQDGFYFLEHPVIDPLSSASSRFAGRYPVSTGPASASSRARGRSPTCPTTR